MAANWKVTPGPVLTAMLLHVLPSCISTVGVNPLIITVARDGIDKLACLEGKIACNTFGFARSVYGNGSDVTMVITYPQILLYEETMTIGIDICNLKLVGQTENDYTFFCSDSNPGMAIRSDPLHSPKQLWFENVQIHCVGELSISDIDSVNLRGYVGQGFSTAAVKMVYVEDSTFIYVSGYKSIIYISSVGLLSLFTIKNSSVIHNNETGGPLLINFWSDSGNVDIFLLRTLISL